MIRWDDEWETEGAGYWWSIVGAVVGLVAVLVSILVFVGALWVVLT